ncbi:hypothetical protein BJF92_17520 [Rhizobium rhizosphaerae]|uniref:FAD-dependent urate hydroxylase HpyO/Asp monooxygenase CreE-like FAD/NAD(P)-binding domain-containing protein n=1 Tax=Xaviernesmea rhizosphaerae TaxID=1672749 RepID=A0A1Q9AIV3_9HYPH|nr:FAD/NAD(P)-binding protein [Xaviernesmea rhizosphaerae]OLP55185.1 hypothetical protein BJF92_17520 [Xaviernesmea rhizosphaerae]
MLSMTEASARHVPPRQPARSRRIVIIGGGFTGAALARRLALSEADLQITVFEPRARLGAGLAYDTRDPALRLNVAAARMKAFPEDTLAFERFLQRTGRLATDGPAEAGGAIYARRSDFGDFMHDALAPLIASGRIVHHREAVTGVHRQNGGYRILGDKGTALSADLLVIATSHPLPCCPQAAMALAGDPRVIANPFETDHLNRIGREDPVLVLGAGLTAVDLLASLRARGHTGVVTLLSRSGALPQPHADRQLTTTIAAPAQAASLRGWLKAVRSAVERAEAEGLPWQSVFDALRQQSQAIWQGLPLSERKRFLRHLRRRFEARRYRMPPQIAALLDSDMAAGRVRSIAARVTAAEATRDGLLLTLRQAGGTARIETPWLAIATGPDHCGIIAQHAYLRQMADQGLIRADGLGLGLACNGASRAIGADGAPVETLFIAGPLARATFGELSGVPEIAAQMDAIARTLLAEQPLHSADRAQPVLS